MLLCYVKTEKRFIREHLQNEKEKQSRLQF